MLKLESVNLCDENSKMFAHFGVDLCECRVRNVDLYDEIDIGLYREIFVLLEMCRLTRNVDLCDVELCEVDCMFIRYSHVKIYLSLSNFSKKKKINHSFFLTLCPE